MTLLATIVLYGAMTVIGTLVSVVLFATAYLTYVHWKFSHIPSPKRQGFKGLVLTIRLTIIVESTTIVHCVRL